MTQIVFSRCLSCGKKALEHINIELSPMQYDLLTQRDERKPKNGMELD